MAITRTLKNSGAPYQLQSSDTVFATTAFTPANSSLIVVIWMIENDGGSTAPVPVFTNNQSLTKTDIVSATNGATDFSSGIFAIAYEVTTGASTTFTATVSSPAFSNIYAYVWEITGHAVGAAIGGKIAGQSGVTNGAFSQTLDATPATGSYVFAGLMGTLDSGTGAVDAQTGYTAIHQAAKSGENIHAVAERTGSASTTAGWSDVSNNATPVAYYHNPLGLAFEIKAASAAAATLSAATPSGTIGTPTSVTVGATTDQTTGTFYVVVDTSGNLSGVTAAQVKAGQKASGASALSSGNASVSGVSPSVLASGLTASTAYAYAAVQNNTNGDSNVVTGTFTTADAAVTTQAMQFGPQGALRVIVTL